MKIEERYVAELQPADYNPRTITDAALSGLRASVKRFGLVEPIIVNERTGNIVGGHQRLKVLLDLGETKTQTIVVDIPEIEEKALNVTLNNPGITGDFNDDLQIILEDVKLELGEDFIALGLSELEIPNFVPVAQDAQLDKKGQTCPKCGYEM